MTQRSQADHSVVSAYVSREEQISQIANQPEKPGGDDGGGEPVRINR